jgi:hypothetical protein
MGILTTILGCLLGAVVFKLLSLVTPVADWGIWSTAILVALMLIFVSFVGGYVVPLFNRGPVVAP